MSGHAPEISVLISTRDRPNDLVRCLESILESDHKSFEVVVVDQSETPVQLLRDDRVRYVESRSGGKSAGLNVAIKFAHADLWAFTDDDCTVPPDWLTKGARVMAENPDVSLLFGALQPIDHDPAQVFVPQASFDRFRRVEAPTDAHLGGGAGADMFARRSLFEAIGEYDELIGPGARFRACEEYDIYYRSLTSGRVVAFEPSLVTVHWGGRPYADGSGRTLKRGYAYGEGAVIGKHLRARDTRMVVVLLRITLKDLTDAATHARHRRLSGLGVIAYKWWGLFCGVATRVDRKRGVFRQRTS